MGNKRGTRIPVVIEQEGCLIKRRSIRLRLSAVSLIDLAVGGFDSEEEIRGAVAVMAVDFLSLVEERNQRQKKLDFSATTLDNSVVESSGSTNEGGFFPVA